MLSRIKEKLKRFKKVFRVNDFGNISKDEILCRQYIELRSIDKSGRRREDLVKTLLKGCIVLDEIGVKYWLGSGTLLGFHRDNDFLPNDIDIDISVYTDKDVYKIIRNMPFDILLVNSCRGRYMQLAFFDNETKVIFDIWFFYDHGRKLYNRNYYGYFWLPSNQFKKMTTINFDGRAYPIPDPEWYCRFWYGENWKRPKKYGEDWTVDYRRNCKGFIYKGAKNIKHIDYYTPSIKL